MSKLKLMLQFFLGPLSLIMTYLFLKDILPLLSNNIQTQIMDGTLGMLMGYFGGTIIVMCLIMTWHSLKKILVLVKK